MDGVLTLLSDPAKALLGTADADAAAAAVRRVGGRVSAPDWLAPAAACDLHFLGAPPPEAQRAALTALAGRPIDAIAQPAQGRRKRLLVADMDSTMVVGETLDELAALAGVGERVAGITARAMNGEIAFEAALRERVGLLAGQPAELLERVLRAMTPMAGAECLVRTMRRHGAYCLLVSGGFTAFTEPVRARLGFDAAEGNRLLIAAGRLTGQVGEPIIGRERKRAALREETERLGLARPQTLAVGDGANDLPMLLAAGLGVAYRAKPSVRRAAPATVEHGDLTALLYVQGYRRGDFVGV